MGNKTDHAAALAEAFHAVYDVKDKLPEGDSRYLAYEAIQKIEALMAAQGFEAPNRHDGEGRGDADRTGFLTLTESEAVEVYGVLALATQILTTTGDKVTAHRYAELNTVLQARDLDANGWS